jgi:hypothetical protein
MTKRLNLGCGPQSRWIEDTDGLDIIDFGQKYVGSIFSATIPEKYDFIFAHHMVEHILDTVALFNRFGELLEVGGILDIRVPILPYEYAFVDPTHVKFIPSVNFFAYFTKHSPAGHCYSDNEFEIVTSNKDRYEWELHVVMRLVTSSA